MTDNGKALVSTHGRKLLTELLKAKTGERPRLAECLNFVKLDPIAGRFCDPETGNNSFHVLLSTTTDESFYVPVLQALLQACPVGLKKLNKSGLHPLHLHLMQPSVNVKIVSLVLSAFPEAASLVDGDGFVPLFYSVMREDSSAEVCRMLCKAFPDGPATANRTNSFPLHFAAKRRRPNIDILRILLRRNPAAAAHVNGHGVLPLHCVCACSDDLAAVKLVHAAFPEAITVQDRQGRLPLHLAVLAVGKEHSSAVAREEAELLLLRESQGIEASGEQSDDEEELVRELQGTLTFSTGELLERAGLNRAVVTYLIEQEPRSLVAVNNFNAIPLDTVLEKRKPAKNERKIVHVYGLYDDPPTARVLLLAHRKYAKRGVIPSLQLRYNRPMRDLNWLARRDAMLLSFQGEPVPGSAAHQRFAQFKASIAAHHSTIPAATKAHNQKGTKGKQQSESRVTPSEAAIFARIVHGDEDELDKRNLLARLRRRGLLDVIRVIVLFL